MIDSKLLVRDSFTGYCPLERLRRLHHRLPRHLGCLLHRLLARLEATCRCLLHHARAVRSLTKPIDTATDKAIVTRRSLTRKTEIRRPRKEMEHFRYYVASGGRRFIQANLAQVRAASQRLLRPVTPMALSTRLGPRCPFWLSA